MKIFLTPHFDTPDTGEGGIRRVVEAQRKWLPTLGVDIVDNIDECDLVAAHAVEWPHTSKPIVSHNHGIYWSEYTWPQWSLNANKRVIESIHRADAVTTVSEWVAQAIRRNTLIDPTVIYHGIDADDWPLLPRKVKDAGYVLWNKTRVDQICDPTPMQSLATIAQDIQFVTTFGSEQKNVQVIGKVPFDESKQIIRDADIYLSTARETFGIGTLEAMICGIPILGWAWGGNIEIVEHRVDGWLSTPGDFSDLEKGLRYCLENKEKMGKVARDKVLKQFTWRKAMEQYVQLYEKVLAANSNIRVSVVVPCYNLGQYLPDTIASIESQPSLTVGDTEIIIVDDASNDDGFSSGVCDTMAEKYPNVTVIHNRENQYLAAALNTGISAAKGKYIVPVDSDNMLGDGCLPVLCDALDGSLGLDIVYGSMQVIEESGKEWVSTWPGEFDFNQQISHHNQIPSTAMYRKKLWQRVGGYRSRCKTAEDADFWCRMTSYGAVPKKVTDMVVLRYRDRHDSMSHTIADWPWEKWYPWHRDIKIAPPISPMGGPVWTYEPPRISVVIPVGPGHTQLVVDAVDSLLAQDFRYWECIVVNDSGTPIPWIHPFVRVIDSGTKRGPAHARNMGFETARAKLVLPLDADDYLQPDALSLLWEAWQKVGGYVYSDWIVQETGEVKETEDYDCESIKRHLPHAVTALYPKAMWAAVGGFDASLDAWEDWDFILALADKGYCGTRLPIPLIQYRIHAGARREQLYAQRETLIENIKNKWSKYYREGVNMPCGGCGGAQAAAQQIANAKVLSVPVNTNNEDLVLLEYVGKVSGPLTFRGVRTGAQYRFGLDPSHRLKYVHKDDMPGFENRPEFVKGKAPTELLQAAGQ